MAKNKLADLNDHLFCQLERLNDDELKGKSLEEEIKRAHAMTQVAEQIISNGNLVLTAARVVNSTQGKVKLPLLLGE